MFTTFQGGPFVEVFTPQVRAAPTIATRPRRGACGIASPDASRSEGRGVERPRRISCGAFVRASRLAIVRIPHREPLVRSPTAPAPLRPPRYPTVSSMLTRPRRLSNVDCRADAGEGPDRGLEDVVRREVGETPVREERQGIRVHHRRRTGPQDAAPEGRAQRTCVSSLPRDPSVSLTSRAASLGATDRPSRARAPDPA